MDPCIGVGRTRSLRCDRTSRSYGTRVINALRPNRLTLSVGHLLKQYASRRVFRLSATPEKNVYHLQQEKGEGRC